MGLRVTCEVSGGWASYSGCEVTLVLAVDFCGGSGSSRPLVPRHDAGTRLVDAAGVVSCFLVDPLWVMGEIEWRFFGGVYTLI